MCVSVLFYWLLRLKPEIEPRYRPVVGELRYQITVPEFRFFVLVAEHYAVSLSLTHRVGEQTLNKPGAFGVAKAEIATRQQRPVP